MSEPWDEEVWKRKVATLKHPPPLTTTITPPPPEPKPRELNPLERARRRMRR